MKVFLISLVLSLALSETLPELVLLTNANQTFGALCLDGSPPGYWIRTATTNPYGWILHLEGGGWCWSESDCASRATSDLGSSKSWTQTTDCYGSCDGILSGDPTINPDFYGWNAVFIGYWDGSSFSSFRQDQYQGLWYRGRPILDAVFDSLLNVRGMSKAQDIILTGGSAGGLSTYLHADYVATLVPPTAKYRALADAGWFLDHTNINSQPVIRNEFQYAWTLWNSTNGVNSDCVKDKSSTDSWQCIFAQYTFPYIKTPTFIAEGLYDSWQLNNILQLGCGDPTPQQTCNSTQLSAFYQYGTDMRNSISSALNSKPGTGSFASACIVHCQTIYNEGEDRWPVWHINNTLIRDAFHSWYYGDNAFREEIDGCDYPCNLDCPVWT